MADQDVDRWRQLDRLCTEALQLAPGERGVFLQLASGGDEALRSDVEVLLECDEAAGAFLDRPAVEELAQALAEDVASLVGQDIGGYRIKSLLGAGGMGEVYVNGTSSWIATWRSRCSSGPWSPMPPT